MSNEQSEGEFIAHDFVSAGRCVCTDGKLGLMIYPINPDGTLGQRRIFSISKGMDKAVGYVYTGATFTETHARGIAQAKYVRRWEDEQDRLRWRSEDAAAADEVRQKRLEATRKKDDEFERIMLPLRKLYESYRRKYDREGCRALDAIVLQTLHTAPRESEKGRE